MTIAELCEIALGRNAQMVEFHLKDETQPVALALVVGSDAVAEFRIATGLLEKLWNNQQTTAMLTEQLATAQHELWSSWMRYQVDIGTLNRDGSVTIPPEKVDRWLGQTRREFRDLTIAEQARHRDAAIKLMGLVKPLLRV